MKTEQRQNIKDRRQKLTWPMLDEFGNKVVLYYRFKNGKNNLKEEFFEDRRSGYIRRKK